MATNALGDSAPITGSATTTSCLIPLADDPPPKTRRKPEIDIYEDTRLIPNLDETGLDFGTTTVGQPVTKTITVKNPSETDLSVYDFSNNLPVGFSLLEANYESTIPATSSINLVFQCDATLAGAFGAAQDGCENNPWGAGCAVRIPSNDGADPQWEANSVENPYTIPFKCVVTCDAKDPTCNVDDTPVETVESTEPILLPIGDKTTSVYNTLKFKVLATHPGKVPLTFSLVDSPTTATIDPNSGIFTWIPTAMGVFNATITVTDAHGDSSQETIAITVTIAPSALNLELSSAVLFLNDMSGVSGKLTRYPSGELGELPIDLQITAPDSTITSATTTTTANGFYTFSDLPAFNQLGTYSVQTTFAGNETLDKSISPVQTVTVQGLAGYALLIQGRMADGSGMDTYNKSLNRVYNIMKTRGFLDENIEYFNYKANQYGIAVDDTPSYEAMAATFERLQAKMNANPAPLFIVMVDHGDADGSFYIDTGKGEKLTPVDLSNWLNTLENGLTSQALAQPRITTIGACYSGSFIPTVSLPGRILITSAAAHEESYKGPTEPDQVRSGEFFIEAFFAQLEKGKSLKTAFELATQSTEILTRIDNNGFDPKYQDNAAQHDGVGNNILYVSYDGEWAKNVYLGLGPYLNVNSPDAAAEILSVTPPIYLNDGESSANLFATVNNPTRVLGGTVLVGHSCAIRIITYERS